MDYPDPLGGAFIAVRLTNRICQSILKTDTESKGTKRENAIWFTTCFICTFGILMMYYYAYYPGSFSADSLGQLAEAVSGNYSDWHPFIHTFLFFSVPIKIFNSEEMIVFLQLLYFSVSFAYLIMTIRKYGCSRSICFWGTAFVLLSPITGNICMYPWKDCGLAIFSMVTMAYYINIILSHGMWLRKKSNAIACGLFLALTILVRHNAILFVLPMIAALLIMGWTEYRHRIISVIIICASILFIIKIPVHHIYNVQKPDYRILESTGMCMVIMGNVLVNCPEVLDDEVRDFLYEVSPREVWEGYYGTGNFNSVKWHSETDIAVIEKAGLEKILVYTFKTFRASKLYSLQAFLKLTGMVWKLDGDLNWGLDAESLSAVEKTEYVLDMAGQEKMELLLKNWKTLMDKSIMKYPMNYIGWTNLSLVSLAVTGINKRKNWKNALHTFPLLCYNYGTALLLTGFDWRFFYLNFPLIIPTVFC